MSDEFRQAASQYLTGRQMKEIDRQVRDQEMRDIAHEANSTREFHDYWGRVHSKDTSEHTDHS